MKIEFVKMHAASNDYIYWLTEDLDTATAACTPERVAKMCHRHTGIGADGVVLVGLHPARMRILNADGSVGKMCGNALRCVAHLMVTSNMMEDAVDILTDSGIRRVCRSPHRIGYYTVDMGVARQVGMGTTPDGVAYRLVDVGNLHAVSRSDQSVDELSDTLRRCTMRQGLNVSCYRRTDAGICMTVNEYGSGHTLGCGSGATAVAYSACLDNICTFGIPTVIQMQGGEVEVLCHKDGHAMLTGDAHLVYRGVWDD